VPLPSSYEEIHRDNLNGSLKPLRLAPRRVCVLAVISGLIGLLGISGMTWLCPVLGLGLRRWRPLVGGSQGPSGVSGAEGRSAGLTLVIAIPAHNEERVIVRTLESIERAKALLRTVAPHVVSRVVVGDDGSTDKTAEIAERRGAGIISSASARGKWRTLLELVDASRDADFIVFVDAGIVWPSDTLVRFFDQVRAPDVFGVAPAYAVRPGGLVERLLWQLERGLKSLENRAGGPVSVHGATVMYRAPELRAALASLADKDFLNDDVIIPLTLRRLFPAGRMVYLPSLEVVDRLEAMGSERRRRARLMHGNLEWLVRGMGADPVVEVLALRRVVRLFWVYWFAALLMPVAGILIVTAPPLGIACVGAMVGALVWPWKPRVLERIVDAAVASWRAPFELVRLLRGNPQSPGGQVWR
jgi:glycosyltransferase involved in cell wall biosynthesis